MTDLNEMIPAAGERRGSENQLGGGSVSSLRPPATPVTDIRHRPHQEKVRYLRGILAAIDWQEQMRVRAIREAIREATAEFWERRATDFEWVMQERFTDRLDACTEGMERNRATALACRRHAHLLRTGFFAEPWWGFDEDFADILAERQVA